MPSVCNLKIVGRVERADGSKLSYAEFWQNYMHKNEPVLLTGLVDDWRACRDWVSPGGLPNLLFFSELCASSRVQIADCNKKDFTDQKRLEMTMAEYVNYWNELHEKAHNIVNRENIHHQALLYLKDWHFAKEYPTYSAYTTPDFFSDDWLNLYLDYFNMHGIERENEGSHCDVSCSDYRFVYIGPKGTWTPLHADVFRSYSWSANICGRKLWHLLSPSQSHLLYDRYKKKTVYNIYDDVSTNEFPGFSETCWLECVQEKHEILFVPAGWFHQVTNQEDTISINHNWFNACNIMWVWNLLANDYNEAVEYIEDIRNIADDFESLCQRNLAANTGMNFEDFFVFICRFALAHLRQLLDIATSWENQCRETHTEFSDLKLIPQLVFNLQSVCAVANKMACHDYFKSYKSDHALRRQDISVLQLKREFFKVSSSENAGVRDLSEADLSIHNCKDLSTFVTDLENITWNKVHSISLEEGNSHLPCESFVVPALSSKNFEVVISNPNHLIEVIIDGITLVKEKFLNLIFLKREFV